MLFNIMEFCLFIFLKFEILWASLSATTQQAGIADLTASTASDAAPHSHYIGLRFQLRPNKAEQHLPCSYGNLDNRSIQVTKIDKRSLTRPAFRKAFCMAEVASADVRLMIEKRFSRLSIRCEYAE